MAADIIPQDQSGFDYQSLGENVEDRDNQQERLIRLAALIETEGHLTIGSSSAGSTRYYMTMYPTIGFTNSDAVLIAEVASTLDQYGVGFVALKSKGRGVGQKVRYDICVHGHDRVTRFLDILQPYLKTKKAQAVILREYIAARAAAKRSPLGEVEWELCKQVRVLNGKRPDRKALARAQAKLESPESIRRPRDLKNVQAYVKMCAELQRELERTPEMSVPPILSKWVKK